MPQHAVPTYMIARAVAAAPVAAAEAVLRAHYSNSGSSAPGAASGPFLSTMPPSSTREAGKFVGAPHSIALAAENKGDSSRGAGNLQPLPSLQWMHSYAHTTAAAAATTSAPTPAPSTTQTTAEEVADRRPPRQPQQQVLEESTALLPRPPPTAEAMDIAGEVSAEPYDDHRHQHQGDGESGLDYDRDSLNSGFESMRCAAAFTLPPVVAAPAAAFYSTGSVFTAGTEAKGARRPPHSFASPPPHYHQRHHATLRHAGGDASGQTRAAATSISAVAAAAAAAHLVDSIALLPSLSSATREGNGSRPFASAPLTNSASSVSDSASSSRGGRDPASSEAAATAAAVVGLPAGLSRGETASSVVNSGGGGGVGGYGGAGGNTAARLGRVRQSFMRFLFAETLHSTAAATSASLLLVASDAHAAAAGTATMAPRRYDIAL